MAGFTDAAFRSICLEHGCGAVVTEMANAYGLTIDHKRTTYYLHTWPDEAPVAAQLYGSIPERLAEATYRVARMGTFAFIDLNAGCPMPKIRNRGDGAGLMKTPNKLYDIVKAMVAEANGLPVTVKTRIGWSVDTINVQETTTAIEEAGAAAIFLHGRVATVRHSGVSDWDLLGLIKRERKIPIIGNGAVQTADDVFRMVGEVGLDGVMIGRAALGNPWLFSEIRARAWNDSSFDKTKGRTDPASVRAKILDHLQREIRLMKMRGEQATRKHPEPEIAAMLAFRAHLVRYLRGYSGVRKLLVHLEERMSPDRLMQLVDDVLADGWGKPSE